MWKIVMVLTLLSVVNGLPAELPKPGKPLITTDYHKKIGIPEAARIKAAEEALEFDGSRIVSGTQSGLGQFPHFGGLLISFESPFLTSVCGSSLISHHKAVTAAHCWQDTLFNATQFEVVLGSTTLFSGGLRIITSDVVTHPDWNSYNLQNDVAVITLSYVGYTNYIRNIALASGSQNHLGWWAQATGFGRQGDDVSIFLNQTLHHVTLQVISNEECGDMYGQNYIFDSTLCVDGSAGNNICGGDSGGPLHVAGPTLIGITSFGYIEGCEQGWPGGFARVTYFEPWIRSQMLLRIGNQ